MSEPPSADRIWRLGYGFMASKALFSAIELGLFTLLAEGPLDGEQIQVRLRLHPRGARDFLDTLVTAGMLERNGGIYSNTAETEFYLDGVKPSYVGNYFEFQSAREYSMFASLSEALRTGKPQNEIKRGEEDWVDAMYANPERLRMFLRAMTARSLPSAMAIARKFPWSKYKTVADVGPAEGCLLAQVALANSHLTGEGFDLPAVEPIFNEYIASFALHERIRFRAGDFFKDPLPGADVLMMGQILHDWDLETKRLLLKKAYDALPRGGALIVYEHLIDDDRRTNLAGLLMSLIMLLETQRGFDFTGAECRQWMREVGFSESHVEQLTGAESMVVGLK